MKDSDSVNPEMVVLNYWDALMSGSIVLPQIDAGVRETIAWLAEHDDADGPAPQFVTRTRQRFAAGPLEQTTTFELGVGSRLPARPSEPLSADDTAWWRRAILPVAAALCLALGLAYLFGAGSLPGRLADRWDDDPTALVVVAPTALPGTPVATPEPLASPTGSPETPSDLGSDVPMLLGNPARLGDTEAVGPSELPEIAWSFDTGRMFRASPVVAGGIVYVGNTGGQFYALDASSGEVVWQIDAGGAVFSTALVADDLVIVPAADPSSSGFVIAFDRVTGAEAWRFPIGDQVFSDPLLYDGVVYLGSDDGFVYAIDPDDGSEVWKVDTGAPASFPAAIDDGVLVIGNRAGKLFAFDAGTGDELWTLEPDLASIVYDPNAVADLSWSMPLIADGRVIVAFRPWHLSPPTPPVVVYALGLSTGEVEWQDTDLVSGGPPIFLWDDGAIRVQSTAQVGATSTLVTFNPVDGEKIGDSIELTGSAGASQTAGVIAGDIFYQYIDSGASATQRGGLNVFDLSSGELIGLVELLRGTGQSDEYSDGRPPAIAGGSIYLGSAGVVFALRAPEEVPSS